METVSVVRFLTLNMICSFLCQCWQWQSWFCFWNVVIFREPQRSIITWLTQTVHCSAGVGDHQSSLSLLTATTDHDDIFISDPILFIMHSLLILSMNYFFLLHQGEWRLIDLSIYIWPTWLHVGQLGCGSSDGGTAALTPVASVHTSLWCDTAAEWQRRYISLSTPQLISVNQLSTHTHQDRSHCRWEYKHSSPHPS